MASNGFDITSFPKSRLAIVDMGWVSRDRHLMSALLEVDVSSARRQARSLRRQGRHVSFTAWMVKAIGDAVARNPAVHAAPLGRRRLVTFDSVDIGLPVERRIDGTRVPLALLIRGVNQKTVMQIADEIQVGTARAITDERNYLLSRNELSLRLLRIYYGLPRAIRTLLWRLMFGNPFRSQRHSGTVTVTTVNAVGQAAGWILITRSMHSLQIALGSVTKKPWVVGDTVEVRDVMHITVAFDHDVIDGVPARNFIRDLVFHIEKADLGEHSCVDRPPEAAVGAVNRSGT